MTELQLYQFIHDNNVEVHIYRNGESVENCNGFEEDNVDEWKIFMFPFISQTQAFIDINSESIFEEEGIDVHLKRGYVAINLLKIMNYYNIEPKNIFK